MTVRLASLAAALALSCAATSAQAATVVNFDSLRKSNGDRAYVYGPYQEQGYSFSASSCSRPAGTCFIGSQTTLSSLDRVGSALINFVGSSVTTVTRSDGAAFLLNAMDVANNYGNWSGYSAITNTVQFTFNFADGTSKVQDYIIDNTPKQRLTVNALSFDQGPLLSFSYKPTTGTSGFLQVDNMSLSAAAVPEASTWAMMIVGFGVTGAAMRRRRRAAVLA